MEFHRYTAVPILSEDGKYVGTVTEGDLLWFLKGRNGISFENAHRYSLAEVPLRLTNTPVSINSSMEQLIGLIKNQNFVPVIDDMEKFIGIVRRSDVIEYCAKLLLTAGKGAGV
jgi:CBS domain-containing protein